MKYRKAKQREGQPTMTGQMRDVLVYLKEAKRLAEEWQPLTYPFAHGRVLIGLMDRDWIFKSEGAAGDVYKITLRGEEALTYFDSTQQARDGMCPRCKKNPRHVRESGVQDAYCLDCLHIRSAEKRARGGDIGDIHRPCSRCRKRARHQYPNGRYSTYCKHCETVNRRRNARKERRRLMKNVKAGAPVPMCKQCKTRPRRVFVNSMSDYCDVCRLPMMRKFKLNRILRAHLPYLR